MKKLLLVAVLFMLYSTPALAQDMVTAAGQCESLCGEYEVLSVDVGMSGAVTACTCDLTNPSRVCCTEGTSIPCRDVCIATNRTCTAEPGRALYCEGSISGPNVALAAGCESVCSPYEVGSLELGEDGALLACGCHVSLLSPVCCDPERSQPCGNGCIPLDRNCSREPGRAMYCPEEEAAE